MNSSKYLGQLVTAVNNLTTAVQNNGEVVVSGNVNVTNTTLDVEEKNASDISTDTGNISGYIYDCLVGGDHSDSLRTTVINTPSVTVSSGSIAVSSGAIDNCSGKLDSIDENIYQCLASGGNADQLRTYITGGTSAVTNDGLDAINNSYVASHPVIDGNPTIQTCMRFVRKEMVEPSYGPGNDDSGCCRVTIAEDSEVAADVHDVALCVDTVANSVKISVQNEFVPIAGTIDINSGTVDINNWPTTQAISGSVTVSSGSININNSPAVTVSSGNITETNSGSISTNLSSQNKTIQRLDSVGSLEATLVSEYKLLYKSWYPASLTSFSQLRFESFSSGAVFSTVGGGSINPNSSAHPWQYTTRFSMCNGQNGLLIVYPVWGTRLDSNTPTLEVGLQYYDNSSYIKLVWDHSYTSPTQITLYWVANLNDMSGGVGMSSWNFDVFDGNGVSGIDLRSSNPQARCMLSPFIALGSSNNMVYVGFVFEGRLRVGHQFSLRFSGTQAASGASGRSGVRPYYKCVANLGAGKTYSCGGFEIYTRHNFYNVLSKEPFCYYGTAAVNTSTTIYPMAIYLNSLTITATPVCMKELYVKTVGTSDVGDFRVEVYHCVDTQFTSAGGSTTTNNVTQILKAATSFGGGTLIASYLPLSDNCIRADLSWIDWKYFGFDQNFTAGTTNVLYFLIINMSSSVNKTAYWSFTWTE